MKKLETDEELLDALAELGEASLKYYLNAIEKEA